VSQPPYPPPNDPSDPSSRPDQPASGQPSYGPGPETFGRDQPAYGQQGYPAESGREYTSTTQYGTEGAPDHRSHGKGFAIAALVLGILGIFLFWAPILGPLLGLTALVLGIIGVRRRAGKGMAITGIVLGALTLIVGVVFSLLWYFAYTVAQDCFDETGASSGPDFDQCIEDRARDLGS
jgi:hypothetical protein